jgi:hypothetical protein
MTATIRVYGSDKVLDIEEKYLCTGPSSYARPWETSPCEHE